MIAERANGSRKRLLVTFVTRARHLRELELTLARAISTIRVSHHLTVPSGPGEQVEPPAYSVTVLSSIEWLHKAITEVRKESEALHAAIRALVKQNGDMA